jgi:hypothetical protein
VHDGSLFPTSIGANPQLSIYGIVARLASGLAQALTGRPAARPGRHDAACERAPRRLLQLVLAQQASGALAASAGARGALGARPGWPLLGLGSVVLVRLAINMNNFRMACFASSHAPKRITASTGRDACACSSRSSGPACW